MVTELLINVRPHETRIALTENGNVVEFYLERSSTEGLTANIYKGKVLRVLPGMQAAFVDIGQSRAAFLYVADVYDQTGKIGELLDFADGLDSPPDQVEPQAPLSSPAEEHQHQIEHLLQEGQEVIVQVVKEPLGQKGARVTTYITLPGRHLVLMPNVKHIGVSRRIADQAERARLKSTIEELRPPDFGFIARTASEGITPDKLESEMDFLIRLWQSIQNKVKTAPTPSLLYQDLDATLRAVRDLFTREVDRLVVDSEPEYNKILNFIDTFSSDLKSAVELYTGLEPIFDSFGHEMEISRAIARKVWLKSGGYIVIEETEALVSIDVNTGRYVGKHNLEETIVKTNLEAVKEIAYQLRLRNIGGLIVIDFIDMARADDQERVWTALVEALRRDKAKTNVLRMSELGLIEMTRQRTRDNIGRVLREPCFYCQGEGYLMSAVSICHEIFRGLEREALRTTSESLNLCVHPKIKEMLLDEERHSLDETQSRLKKRVIIQEDGELHLEEYQIEPVAT